MSHTLGGVEDESVAVSFGFWLKVKNEFCHGVLEEFFWLEAEDERVYRDCLLLRIFLDFQSNFIGRAADGGLLI